MSVATSPAPTTSSNTPAAEFVVDAALARRLLASQHPDLSGLPLTHVANGWDNVIFRLGDDLALRLPRRLAAVGLTLIEQHWLPQLPALPLAIPVPVRRGVPGEAYPWPWSVIPWTEGRDADLAPPDDEQGEVLAGFFRALHVAAPPDAPRNPYRGVPLADRLDSFETRAASAASLGRVISPAVRQIFERAVATPIDIAPTWLQGDPHPRNVLVDQGRIVAVIDWGDMCQGDRASDLSAIWMLFAAADTRRRAVAALADVTPDTWIRARGWAAWYGVMLFGLGDDPRMAAIGAATLERITEEP
jgi:aminoglycoside phosphotransferase (APT) family kinase protein